MLTVTKRAHSMGFIVCLIMAGSFFATSDAFGQGAIAAKMPAGGGMGSPAEKTAFTGYKGLAIGATTDAVRQKLGEPKDKSTDQDLYLFSDTESAQFYYNAARSVTAIMITYTGNLAAAPTARDVLGEDVPPKPDGAVFKMVRFPKAGYWISYNRSGGSDATISIAIQKM